VITADTEEKEIMIRISACTVAAFTAFSLGTTIPTFAQETYPSKPMRLIIPIPAGAVTDVVLRAAAQELSTRMGQPMLADNRPGANMIIAAEACAKAPGDGYTLCIVSPDAMSFNPHTFNQLPYDVDRDFKPVANLFYLIEGLIASASLPANSVKELQALAVAKPGSIDFGTLGPGTGPDLFRQYLNRQWKTNIVGIPYKGGNFVVTALMAGEIHVSKTAVGNVSGQLSGGKVKILAVNSAKRSPLLPDVPAVDEVGLGGFTIRVWWGLVVPSATPDTIVRRLNGEFVKLFREPKFNDLLETRFLEPALGSVESFAAFVKADREAIGHIVKEFNIPRQ
jgi:tripartite-type tricarboxylate transporter receptor subunit TctC